jgi:hypothetical protein
MALGSVQPHRATNLMARIAAVFVVIGALLVAIPAAMLAAALAASSAQAQFGNIFNDSPPRPPGSVPNGGFPAQPPPVQYPGQPNGQPQYQQPPQQNQPPPQQASRPPNSIQAKPLAPPPGATSAPPPSQANVRPVPAPAVPPPPEPADTSPQPDDTVVTFTPTQKIANGRAIFSGLDKITGRIISFDAAIGETVQFGALQVTARACNTRPPTEPTNTDAFVEVDEVTLQGEIKRIFTGWMFAASPGLHAVEHPIYDVWLTDCAQPAGGAVAQTVVPPTPAAGVAPPGATQAKARQAPAQRPPPLPPAAPAPVTDD